MYNSVLTVSLYLNVTDIKSYLSCIIFSDIILFSEEELANNNGIYDTVSPENCGYFKRCELPPRHQSGHFLKSKTFPQSGKAFKGSNIHMTEFVGADSPERPRRLSESEQTGNRAPSSIIDHKRMFWRPSSLGTKM